MSSAAPPNFPERYRKGVWLFNQRYFFECHEILEAEWRDAAGKEKLFYQMLIHAAVTFVHWENGNRKGVLSLAHTFDQKAAAVGCDEFMGLNIVHLRADMHALIDPLRASPDLPLQAFAEVATPVLAVNGFVPLECSEHELAVLSREIKEEQD
ncbi:MAG TPA: DUF309 domain-containing protein [Planctomycetota bacterium]|jgi:hypothetical protein